MVVCCGGAVLYRRFSKEALACSFFSRLLITAASPIEGLWSSESSSGSETERDEETETGADSENKESAIGGERGRGDSTDVDAEEQSPITWRGRYYARKLKIHDVER
eukprot:COSAG05_NODE_13325_length_434_cov_0.925373_1_plen_106_part_01